MSDLRGCTVVVTRPRQQATGLLGRLGDAGARVIPFPVIEIQPLSDPASAIARLGELANCDLVIFISRNAVVHGLPLLQSTALMRPTTRIATVGRGTAEELRRHGIVAGIMPPSGSDSEALLATPALANVNGREIIIVRGCGGREMLADTLRVRGAKVHYLECYRRLLPQADVAPLCTALQEAGVDAVVVTSNEGLRNLYRLLGERCGEALDHTPLYVISPAMVELSHELGYKLDPVLMPSARDDDVYAALVQHCRPR